MSADNFIAIFKDDDGRFRGYMGFMSDAYEIQDTPRHVVEFNVGTIEEAIIAAQNNRTEYGYFFVNLTTMVLPPPPALTTPASPS